MLFNLKSAQEKYPYTFRLPSWKHIQNLHRSGCSRLDPSIPRHRFHKPPFRPCTRINENGVFKNLHSRERFENLRFRLPKWRKNIRFKKYPHMCGRGPIDSTLWAVQPLGGGDNLPKFVIWNAFNVISELVFLRIFASLFANLNFQLLHIRESPSNLVYFLNSNQICSSNRAFHPRMVPRIFFGNYQQFCSFLPLYDFLLEIFLWKYCLVDIKVYFLLFNLKFLRCFHIKKYLQWVILSIFYTNVCSYLHTYILSYIHSKIYIISSIFNLHSRF